MPSCASSSKGVSRKLRLGPGRWTWRNRKQEIAKQCVDSFLPVDLARRGTPSVGNNMMDQPGSSGGSEASVNQQAPNPEPPEPLAPDLSHPLLDDNTRSQELNERGGWASSVRVFIDRVDLYAEGGETRCSAVCHSPVLDKAGKNLALKGGIPPVRFIHSIFFNFFLDDMDRKFLSKFPGATFARFSHQLLIPIGTDKSRNNIRVRDLEKAFLAELDSGIILQILKPGDGKFDLVFWSKNLPARNGILRQGPPSRWGGGLEEEQGGLRHWFAKSKWRWFFWVGFKSPSLNWLDLYWPHPPLVNSDGCAKGNPGEAGAGGLIRDARGQWLVAFTCDLGICTSVTAGIRLSLAWDEGYRLWRASGRKLFLLLHPFDKVNQERAIHVQRNSLSSPLYLFFHSTLRKKRFRQNECQQSQERIEEKSTVISLSFCCPRSYKPLDYQKEEVDFTSMRTELRYVLCFHRRSSAASCSCLSFSLRIVTRFNSRNSFTQLEAASKDKVFHLQGRRCDIRPGTTKVMEAQGGLLFLKELVATFERRSELPLLLNFNRSPLVVIPGLGEDVNSDESLPRLLRYDTVSYRILSMENPLASNSSSRVLQTQANSSRLRGLSFFFTLLCREVNYIDPRILFLYPVH
ncbi:hypothetical protein VNO77_47126 [Canavalia gladiata]|uniref:Uncharacterized protein n=1 Tax=Canavalia gladiata TaxID=3824 RepID=A0AAN9JFL4_CANGL